MFSKKNSENKFSDSFNSFGIEDFAAISLKISNF